MAPDDLRSVLTARHFGWLSLGLLVFAVYGSLVPFDYQPVPFDEAIARFRAACSAPVRIGSRSDWAANILLFLPLGFVAVGALAVDRAWWVGLVATIVVVPLCGLASAGIEFLQLYFPTRNTSINDMAAETLGATLGAALWLAVGQRLTQRLRQFWTGMGEQGPAGLLLPVYLIFLIFYQSLPFDLTISPVEIYHKFKDGRLVLRPFAEVAASPFDAIQKHLLNLVFFLPVGLLLAGLPSSGWRSPRSWIRVLLIGAGVACLVEFVQLFVLSHYTKTSDVIIGSLGVLLGWLMGLSCAVPACGRVPRVGLWTVYVGLLVFVSWQPFNFHFSSAVVSERLGRMSWVPFLDYFEGDYLHALGQFVEKTLLFLPLGLLLLPYFRWPTTRKTRIAVLLVGLLLELTLEGGQLLLPTRYASVSDVLVGVAAVFLGFAVRGRIFLPADKLNLRCDKKMERFRQCN